MPHVPSSHEGDDEIGGLVMELAARGCGWDTLYAVAGGSPDVLAVALRRAFELDLAQWRRTRPLMAVQSSLADALEIALLAEEAP